jgi:hypothetical protein
MTQRVRTAAPQGATAPAPTALPSHERAELHRQGAKAAARGEDQKANPMERPGNIPQNTGEAQQTWSERRDAWRAGHEAQANEPGEPSVNPKGEADGRERE